METEGLMVEDKLFYLYLCLNLLLLGHTDAKSLQVQLLMQRCIVVWELLILVQALKVNYW